MIKAIKCKQCEEGHTLAMSTPSANGTTIVWCPCIELDLKAQNSILESLRSEGFDISPDQFNKIDKEQCVGKLAGKFTSKKALQKGFDHLVKMASVPELQAARIVEMIGLEKAYIRIQANFKKRQYTHQSW